MQRNSAPMEFIGSPWPAVTAALKKAKASTAVTAYLTSPADEILALKGDQDRLVVDASEATVRAGLTDPHVVEKFMKRGVRCYSVEGLHAKVYVADGVMFCGSPNATANSKNERLEEACLRVKNAGVIEQFEDWLQQLRLEPLDKKRVAALKKIYKPAKWSPGRRTGKADSAARSWVTWTNYELDSEEIDDHLESLAREKKMRTDDLDFVCIPETWKPTRLYREIRPGDEIFVIEHYRRSKYVWRGARVIAEPRVVDGQRLIPLETGEKYARVQALTRASRLPGMKFLKKGTSERELSAKTARLLRRLIAMNA